MSKKIISYSLWGCDEKYTIGSIQNAHLAKIIYPGWICRFYIGQSTFINCPHIISELSKFDNTEIVSMPTLGDWTGMFWRFLPASENDVEIMLSRDCDSRLSMREKHAVDSWIKSEKTFHIMRDHPFHNAKILGGMWGVKKGVIIDILKLIESYTLSNRWQIDQEFLAEIIYPQISSQALIHDPFFDKVKFPTKRVNYEFVGDVFNQKNERDLTNWKTLKDYESSQAFYRKMFRLCKKGVKLIFKG